MFLRINRSTSDDCSADQFMPQIMTLTLSYAGCGIPILVLFPSHRVFSFNLWETCTPLALYCEVRVRIPCCGRIYALQFLSTRNRVTPTPSQACTEVMPFSTRFLSISLRVLARLSSLDGQKLAIYTSQ